MTCQVKKDEGARVQKRINTQRSLAREEKEVINILRCPKKKERKKGGKATYTSLVLITNYTIMSLGGWNKEGANLAGPGWVRAGGVHAAGKRCWAVSWGENGCRGPWQRGVGMAGCMGGRRNAWG